MISPYKRFWSFFLVAEFCLLIAVIWPHFLSFRSFTILFDLLIEYLVSTFHICTSKARFDTATIVDSDETVIIPSFKISRLPITPLGRIHSPKLALPYIIFHLYSLYFTKLDGFTVSEGEEITFDDYSVAFDNDIFILIIHRTVWHF